MQNTKTADRKIRIGIISALWLPKFGGGEQYVYRMAQGLISEGLDVRVFCGTGQKVGFDNGQLPVTRFAPKGNIEFEGWRPKFSERTPEYLRTIANHFDWFNEAVNWSKKNALDAAIICNPFQQVYYFHARELHLRLRDLGIAVGFVHHDLPPSIEQFLKQVYVGAKNTWEQVSKYVLEELGKAIKSKPGIEGYLEISSPLAFAPDFVIANSDWVLRFIDPLNTQRRFVYHGPIDADHWRKKPEAGQVLQSKDVLMVNPQNRKGPAEMRQLIENGRDSWSYRLLKGGWGDSFKTFRVTVDNTKANKDGRVEFLDYVQDMRNVYAAAGVMFFPSHWEGYGLAAVEPMFLGTPVVSSNYPAILEAVGDGAKTLCPHKNSAEEWRDAVDDVLTNREFWSNKALARAEALRLRQETQTKALAKFLVKQVTK